MEKPAYNWAISRVIAFIFIYIFTKFTNSRLAYVINAKA